jgi:hypothetical protein
MNRQAESLTYFGAKFTGEDVAGGGFVVGNIKAEVGSVSRDRERTNSCFIWQLDRGLCKSFS